MKKKERAKIATAEHGEHAIAIRFAKQINEQRIIAAIGTRKITDGWFLTTVTIIAAKNTAFRIAKRWNGWPLKTVSAPFAEPQNRTRNMNGSSTTTTKLTQSDKSYATHAI